MGIHFSIFLKSVLNMHNKMAGTNNDIFGGVKLLCY